MRQLDDTDIEILRLLAEDSSRSYSEIAEKVNLSTPSVSDRINRLKEVGVIKGFTVEIDRGQVGGESQMFVELDVRPEKADSVWDAVAEDSKVEHVVETADSRILVLVHLADNDVRSWLSGVTELSNLRDYDVSPVTRS
ncbi:MAG: AsnC family transcriptional regulator, partial [Halobacteria archaeon]|nr:AsnC family transcriptional regulator [Halobacteria archaeon]